MQAHEALEKFPKLSDEEFEGLKKDIAENGLREPIWTYQGRLIDGRARKQACDALGIACASREWNGSGSLTTWIVSRNLHRRHLEAGPIAVLTLQLVPYYEAEAAEQKRLGQIKGGLVSRPPLESFRQRIDESSPNSQPSPTRNYTEENARKAVSQAAAATGANRQYVYDCKVLANKAPDLLHKVGMNEITVPEAKRQLDAREEKLPTLQKEIDDVCDKLRGVLWVGSGLRKKLEGLLELRVQLEDEDIQHIQGALNSLKTDCDLFVSKFRR